MAERPEENGGRRTGRGLDERRLPRRFYQTVSVTDDLTVALDGRVTKTPMKKPLALPNAALAHAVAGEWRSQADVIDPSTMRLTKLANTAIDRATAERAKLVAEIVAYAGSDLVCYRATAPETLVRKQDKAWDPVIEWVAMRLDAVFVPVAGIMHKAQPAGALDAVRAYGEKLDPFRLTAVHTLTTTLGSALLSVMLVEGGISSEAAWTIVHIDEDHQIEGWGRDSEAESRRAAHRADFLAVCSMLDLLGSE